MRLIDADNAIHALGVFSDVEHGNKHFLNGINSAKEIINECVTIDAVPVVHGRWIEPDENDSTTACICSLCDWRGHIMEDDVMGMPYCPNCGAKMDGERRNDDA